MKKITIGDMTITSEQLRKAIKDNPEVLEEEKYLNRYFFPKEGKIYLHMGEDGDICEDEFRNKTTWRYEVSMGVHETEKQVVKEAARQKAKVAIWKYAQENDLILDCDWGDVHQEKHYPCYDHNYKEIMINCSIMWQSQAELPYTDKENCHKLIEAQRENILIYFNQQ